MPDAAEEEAPPTHYPNLHPSPHPNPHPNPHLTLSLTPNQALLTHYHAKLCTLLSAQGDAPPSPSPDPDHWP